MQHRRGYFDVLRRKCEAKLGRQSDGVFFGWSREVDRKVSCSCWSVACQIVNWMWLDICFMACPDVDRGDAMEAAARHGDLAVVQRLHARSTPMALTHAAHLDLVRWLHEFRTEGCTDNAVVYQWLHLHRPQRFTTEATDRAAQEGQLESVLWLHLNRTEVCMTKEMNGKLDMTRWLHDNRFNAH